MTYFGKIAQAIFAEFERLGLNPENSPYAAAASGDAADVEQFLARLRAMESGVAWRDVYPDMLAGWVRGRPEARRPCEACGSFDYPSPSARPAFYSLWPDIEARPQARSCLISRRCGCDCRYRRR